MNVKDVLLVFHPIDIADRPRLMPYLRDRRTTCDWTFANLFCWQDYYKMQWAEWNHWLIIRCRINGERRIGYMVVPETETQSYSEIVPVLSQEALRENHLLLLANLSEKECALLQSQCPDAFLLDRNRDFDDYLYEREALATLRGQKLAAKRNHVNKFSKTYSYQYEVLERKDFDECLRLENEWRGQHSTSSDDLTAEQQAIRMAFRHYEELQLYGGLIRVDGHIVAFTYGSALDDHTFCTHVEKADTSYDGVFPMINYLFAQQLPSSFTHINREEDMGLPGLRKSKLSYHPFALMPKYVALQQTEDMRGIQEVWRICFGDEETFVHSFLARYYFKDNAFVHYEEGRVVSMAFCVPCVTELGPTAYLYAIATLPEYRGRGYAASLVRQALASARQCGYTAAMLIPADSGLKDFYLRLGFKDVDIPVSFADELDLGTGEPIKNRAMLAPLSENLQWPEEIHCQCKM